MKTTFDKKIDIPEITIDVPEDPAPDGRPTEVPVISIEKGHESPLPGIAQSVRPTSVVNRWWLLAIIFIAIVVAGIIAYFFLNSNRSEKFPQSVSDKENIAKLETPVADFASGTDSFSDSVLGVAMDFYPLNGLIASLEREIPDSTDQTLVLFMRSADYHPDGRTIGSIVVNGELAEGKERESRPAYVAISPEGKAVIGVSTTDKLLDYTVKNSGSFFRQFVLLSDGTLPEKFHLHGKVERAALGRTTNDQLFYIVTRHKETMYDFADALREYGFVDAVYITGGNSYNFSRDTSGHPHATPEVEKKFQKYNSRPLPAPLLVFRRKL